MEEEEERRGQEQQAIEQYMAMNPELFKHHKANWDKANELRKSETVGRISVSKIEKTRDTLVKDFRHTTEAMMKEIMAVVADDLKGKK